MAVLMQARFNSKCSACSGFIDRGSNILYDRATKTAAHETCPVQTKPVQPELPTVSPAEAAVMVFLLTPATRAFLDANDPKSVEQARNALRLNANVWQMLVHAEQFLAGDAADAPVADASKTIFDDVAHFVELTDPRVAPVAPAPVTELDGYKAALENARAAGDAAAVAALEASIAAATAPKIDAPPPAPAPAPRAPPAPAMGSRFSAQRGRRVARAAAPRPAPAPSKVERDDLPF